MSRILKLFVLIEFILILAIIALTLADSRQMPTAYAVKENMNTENISFKIMTKAVCENKSDYVLCRDELFASCNGREYIISANDPEGYIECGNIKIRLSDIANDSDKLKKW